MILANALRFSLQESFLVWQVGYWAILDHYTEKRIVKVTSKDTSSGHFVEHAESV